MLASVILILVLGIVADRLFRWLKLPGLLHPSPTPLPDSS